MSFIVDKATVYKYEWEKNSLHEDELLWIVLKNKRYGVSRCQYSETACLKVIADTRLD